MGDVKRVKHRTAKGAWYESAGDINMDIIDDLLYRSHSVNEFLDHKFFIVADKGIGKTLLLKKKKYDLLNYPEHIFIPSGSGGNMDVLNDLLVLSKSQMNFLEDQNNAKRFWSLALELSAVKNYDISCKKIIEPEDEERVPAAFKDMFLNRDMDTPCTIFLKLALSLNDIMPCVNQFSEIMDSLFRRIRSNVVNIFIDRLDHALRADFGCSKEMWINVQLGLLDAAWDVREKNKRVRVFCSIRKEAYEAFHGDTSENVAADVCVLRYSKKELRDLVNTLSNYYEDIERVEDLVGFGGDGSFVHPRTGRKEDVFSYMLRHTVDRPRDLVKIASSMKNRIDPTDEVAVKVDELRIATNEVARIIAEKVFEDKINFLECIKYERDRRRFLSLIPKNTLSQKNVKEICREFNRDKTEEFCSRNGCLRKDGEDGCKHPFCELYSIGLLGYVKAGEDEQRFRGREPVKHVTGAFDFFVVHPSLCDVIDDTRLDLVGVEYVVTPGIITGDRLAWRERETNLSNLVDEVLGESEAVGSYGGMKIKSEALKRIRKAVVEEEPCEEETANFVERLANEVRGIIASIKEEAGVKEEKKSEDRVKIFLSYCSKDDMSSDDIDSNLKNKGFSVTRDIRDLKYMANVNDFMASLSQHDYVVTVVSENYLKSENCMKEIGNLLNNKDYEEKTIIVVLPSAKGIYGPNEVFEYLGYWKKERKNFDGAVKKLLDAGTQTDEDRELVDRQIKIYNEISEALPRFLAFIKGVKGFTFRDLEKSGYQELVDYILRNRLGRVTV
jgi:hypothetical protein